MTPPLGPGGFICRICEGGKEEVKVGTAFVVRGLSVSNVHFLRITVAV